MENAPADVSINVGGMMYDRVRSRVLIDELGVGVRAGLEMFRKLEAKETSPAVLMGFACDVLRVTAAHQWMMQTFPIVYGDPNGPRPYSESDFQTSCLARAGLIEFRNEVRQEAIDNSAQSVDVQGRIMVMTNCVSWMHTMIVRMFGKEPEVID